MTNEQTPSVPRATVVRFDVPIGQPARLSAGAVRTLHQSTVARQLLLSLAARDVSAALHEADRFVGQAAVDVAADALTPAQRESLLDRSAVALSLGDRVKRDVANEKAALELLRAIDHGVRGGSILEHSPLAQLDLASARLLAKFAVAGALNYLSGRTAR